MNHAAQELLVLAQLTYRVGQAEDARAYLRSLLTINPEHPEGIALAEQLGAAAPVADEMPVEEEDLQLTDPAGPEVMVIDEDATVEVGSLEEFDVSGADLDEAIELVEEDEESEPSFDIEEDVPIDVEEDALLDDELPAEEEAPVLDVGEEEILDQAQSDGAETVIAMSPMDIESLEIEAQDKSEFEEERQATVNYPTGSAEQYLDQDEVGAPDVIELLDDEGTPARPVIPPEMAMPEAVAEEPELIEFGEDEEFFEELPEPAEPEPEPPKSPPPTKVDEAPAEEFAQEFQGEELGPDDLEPIEDLEDAHKPTAIRPASREELEMAGLGADELSSEAMSAIDEAVEGEVDEVFVEDVLVEPQDEVLAEDLAVEDVSIDDLPVEEIGDDEILIDDEPVITEPIQVPEEEALDDTEPEVAEPLPEEPEEEEEDELADALEEIDFYMQQNLLEEAAEELEQLREAYPDNAEVLERVEKIERMQQGEAPIAQLSPDDLEGPFDLATEIEREVGEDAAPVPLDEDFQYSFDDVFSEFKKGVERVVAKEDSSTHFDLGIAYKEMGLVEDAISEFTIAAQDGEKRISAMTMIGLCHVEKGQYSEAINRFKDALHGPGISEQESTGVYYEMGCTYELLTDVEEALFYFKKVQKRNSNFRDVAARIKALTKAGVEPRKDEGEKKKQKKSSGSKNKISYM
jgi:tetratricopeptide (TPR) repeat protein